MVGCIVLPKRIVRSTARCIHQQGRPCQGQRHTLAGQLATGPLRKCGHQEAGEMHITESQTKRHYYRVETHESDQRDALCCAIDVSRPLKQLPVTLWKHLPVLSYVPLCNMSSNRRYVKGNRTYADPDKYDDITNGTDERRFGY
jgi:hypothetical protein